MKRAPMNDQEFNNLVALLKTNFKRGDIKGWSTKEIDIINNVKETRKVRKIDIFQNIISSERKITDLVAETIELDPIVAAAKKVGINVKALRYIRKMVIINKHHMEANDRTKLQYCFDKLNSEKSLLHVRIIANPIINKYWLRIKPKNRTQKIEIEKFERALFALHEVCEAASEFNVPFGYSAEKVKAARTKVNSAKKSLVTLIQKLEGRSKGEDQ